MERKLLTAEIAGAYIKSRIAIGNNTNPHKIQGIKEYSVFIGKNDTGIDLWFKLSECQLILTPLSEITDEHKIEIGKIARHEIEDLHHLRNIGASIAVDFFNGHNLLEFGFTKIQALLDHLRLRKYDLGYGQIESLIEAGIAIKG